MGHPRLDRARRAWVSTGPGCADRRAVGRVGRRVTAAVGSAAHDDAVARLHALLLRAAQFEVRRRRPTLPHLRGDDLDDTALQAADDALMSVLAHLDDFRGLSRFTT